MFLEINQELRILNKKKRREFEKHRKSDKYLSMQSMYKSKIIEAKASYYNKKVVKLKKNVALCSRHVKIQHYVLLSKLNLKELSDLTNL